MARDRFLVAPRDASTQVLLESRLRSDPEIAVLRVLAPATPGRLPIFVTEMTPERAARLDREMPGDLTIERDAPLTPS